MKKPLYAVINSTFSGNDKLCYADLKDYCLTVFETKKLAQAFREKIATGHHIKVSKIYVSFPKK